jgi:hypothetical protein
MKLCLDNKFTISSDKYNWILIENQSGNKVKRHYFPSIKLLTKFIGDYKLRECLISSEVSLCKNSPVIPPYTSVIEETIVKLERYIEECIHGKK